MFFTCLSVGAVRATLVFSISSVSPRSFRRQRGVRYRKHRAAQAATKSFPRAVPDATDVLLFIWTLRRISCCSGSRFTPRASRTNLFQSARHEFIASKPAALILSLRLFAIVILSKFAECAAFALKWVTYPPVKRNRRIRAEMGLFARLLFRFIQHSAFNEERCE
ncbi:hypothetical protein [Bacteroides sp.]|uniref:hypothetical protein n=1 Tax=Bacteroides sp. TaxID=29523 RepID=UPI003AAC3B08